MDIFRVGSQCGLKPNEVLDMSFDVFTTCVRGYADRLFDSQTLAIQTGFWAAYYSNSKHPKSVENQVKAMIKRKEQYEDTAKTSLHLVKPEVDVEAFKATEEQFLRRLSEI